MSDKIFRQIGKQLLWNFFPAFFILSTRLPFTDPIYVHVTKIFGLAPGAKDNVELFFFVLGLVWLTVAWPIRLSIIESKMEKERKSNVTIKRLMYCSQLADLLGVDKSKLSQASIRFFKRKRRFLKFDGVVVFKCHQIESLYYHEDEIKDDLEFIVSPKNESQGLVGRAYIEGECNFKDGSTKNDQEYNEYYERMSQHQKVIAGNHKFVLTIAVKDKSNKIKAIISFDNTQSIGVNSQVNDQVLLNVSKIGKDLHREFKNFL